jgi:hypothetical protein
MLAMNSISSVEFKADDNKMILWYKAKKIKAKILSS